MSCAASSLKLHSVRWANQMQARRSPAKMAEHNPLKSETPGAAYAGPGDLDLVLERLTEVRGA